VGCEGDDHVVGPMQATVNMVGQEEEVATRRERVEVM
jgi:hypothetical protein